MWDESRIQALERQVKALRRVQHQHHEWLDTICSPLYKRIWWWLQGYYFYKVGRWR